MQSTKKKGAAVKLLALLLAIGAGISLAVSAPLWGCIDVVWTVSAYESVYYDVVLVAGVTTYISVYGDGDTDLDVIVYDEYGNRVAWDTRRDLNAFTNITPYWTGPFRIEIRNTGSVYNVFTLYVC